MSLEREAYKVAIVEALCTFTSGNHGCEEESLPAMEVCHDGSTGATLTADQLELIHGVRANALIKRPTHVRLTDRYK